MTLFLVFFENSFILFVIIILKLKEVIKIIYGSLRKFCFVLTVFVIGLLVTSTVYADDGDSDRSNLKELGNVKISVTNDQTGKTTFIKPEDSDFKVNYINTSGDTTVIGYDVFIPIKVESHPYDPNLIGIDVIDGRTRTSGGVTARLYVDYDWRSNTYEIRVNRVYGGWTPSSNIYRISNREVNAHSGAGFGGKKISRKPTSNSFSYTTGWGYNKTVTGDLGPRAWSSARVTVDGMSGTSHTINVDFTFPY